VKREGRGRHKIRGSKAAASVGVKKICGFTWTGRGPHFDSHMCTREKGHEGNHRSREGNKRPQ